MVLWFLDFPAEQLLAKPALCGRVNALPQLKWIELLDMLDGFKLASGTPQNQTGDRLKRHQKRLDATIPTEPIQY